jgi:hypothetical protein
VEGQGLNNTSESVIDSRDEKSSDVTVNLSGLLAGIPSFASPQRLATSLRQKFIYNSGELCIVVYTSNFYFFLYIDVHYFACIFSIFNLTYKFYIYISYIIVTRAIQKKIA